MHLRNGSLLQGGKYRIEKVLGQGGFGITYLGVQVGLNRQVAIKEFFMKEYCNREEDTSHVTVPSIGSRQQVDRFRDKFMKEAQSIASLSHPSIIRIYDVFEENGTAYYVMEYHSHGSLSELVQRSGRLDETDALRYIRQIADALAYIHERNMNHLDIKPSNVLLDDKDNVVLIDFGMSKRYDEEGNQTSTTPVGISHGYAPMEQYNAGGVNTFSPQVDIYSLGATLYKLLTGKTPPQANEVFNEGLPALPSYVFASTVRAITEAMRPARKDRPCSVGNFLSLLDEVPVVVVAEDKERTEMVVRPHQKVVASNGSSKSDKPDPSPKKWWIPLLACLVAGLCIWGLSKCVDGGGDEENVRTVALDTVPAQPTQIEQPMKRVETPEPLKTVSTLFYATTTPSGASVYVDGKYVGKTPIKDKEISIGSHTVKIALDGYKTFTKKYALGEKPFILNETLEAMDATPAPQSEPAPVKNNTNNTVNGHGYVDLGLSVKWADCNVGASAPKEDGSYFTWTRSRMSFANVVEKELNGWKGNWRLPTVTEFTELLNRCKWIWNSQGYYKVVGPNGNSIILPAAGFRNGKTLNDVNEGGYYWCSSPYDGGAQDAYYLYFYSGDHTVTWGSIGVERSVRFVVKEEEVKRI